MVMLVATVLAGCASERPTFRVEAAGDRAVMLGDRELAVREYQEVVHRRPEKWQVRLKLAEQLLELDRPAEAREHLEAVWAVQPENPRVLDLLAEAMLRSGDVESMARELRVEAEASGDAADWLRLGTFLALAGDADNAEQALLTGARLDRGESIQYQLALADLYRRIGDDERALDRYRMALYLDPTSDRAIEGIRAYDRVAGPTFELVPLEQRAAR